ncbi:hypothetical protein A2Z33_02955 [Candidatus Gottesmanbacteria bacterium RBG_16_52_11]|uniref:Glycosyl transferase family 1 domain-containing protein n=1 Tax=Candidatus Gottesmanbacteria bacterium RBG_16_52_11 TaxID=1798374 RepID=A0A1F5YMH6_9BACT|nr:MAG: hypothetical protein A2Z33_02955 [Candidatus Gottesmanbacteria bacterium RBG_16_52_11]
MRIGIGSPYLDSLGGGERYMLTLASHLIHRGHSVHIFWNDTGIRNKILRSFGLDFPPDSFRPDVFRGILPRKLLTTSEYDVIIYLSDGSIPYSLAKRNILHFQVPFPRVQTNSVKNGIWKEVIVNSKYTRENLDQAFSRKAVVIYPPVASFRSEKTVKKSRMEILSVGRFSSHYRAKKHEVMIGTFKRGFGEGKLKDWKLILAGACLSTDKEYLEELKLLARGIPVDFRVNIPDTGMRQLYGEAVVYWHAAGFGEKDPTKMEHFGISVVEAMSAKCVPVVFNGGGLPEIVNENNGFLWHTPEELLTHTVYIGSHLRDIRIKKIMNSMGDTVRKFSTDVFKQRIDELIGKSDRI